MDRALGDRKNDAKFYRNRKQLYNDKIWSSGLPQTQKPSRTQGRLEKAQKAHKILVKRSKSNSTLDKACQHRLESNELNSTWHWPSKLWRNRYIKLRSKGAFWQSKLELPISSGSGDMKLQAVWRHYFKKFGDVKRSGDATNRPIMTKFKRFSSKKWGSNSGPSTQTTKRRVQWIGLVKSIL